MPNALAIMFLDIADSTRLYEVQGDLRATEVTRKALFQLRAVVEANGGRVIKMLGDGALAAFTDADGAARTAISMQSSDETQTLRFRIGLHHGPVVQQTEDIYGDACNVAARVQSIARPGEILATGEFIQHLSTEMQEHARALHNISLRGRSTPVRLYEIVPPGEDEKRGEDTTLAHSILSTTQEGAPTLRVAYRGNDYTLTPLLPRLTVGRDETCGIRIHSRQTSRHHAKIDYSRDSFVITDHSTNGTFIRTDDPYPVRLHRDSTKLLGSGLIGFGADPQTDDDDHVVSFRCTMG